MDRERDVLADKKVSQTDRQTYKDMQEIDRQTDRHIVK